MQDLLVRGQMECGKSWREYKKAGYLETKGTVMMIPPSEDELKEAFTRPHKGTTMTVGARALCKHHARKSNHPFWSQPSGSLAAKNRLAEKHLEQIMKEANWKNIFRLHGDIIILEMRVKEGYGMRWRIGQDCLECVENLKFMGYLEPQLLKVAEKQRNNVIGIDNGENTTSSDCKTEAAFSIDDERRRAEM